MYTVKARYDGRVFIPDQPVDLPVGFVLDISIEPPSPPEAKPIQPLTQLLEELEHLPENPDWPPDGAAQHDHYLYGTPKRENP